MLKKRKKIFILISSVVLLLALVYIGSLIRHHWDTDPEPMCNLAGGNWTGVYGCDNLCSPSADDYCPDKIIFSCSCGLGQCWNGTDCVPIGE